MAVGPPKQISRRSFVKYAAIGGLAAWGAVSAAAYPAGWDRWLRYGQKPWELELGVVDYDRVPDSDGTMTTVPQYYLDDPSRRILNVAQWYDYWPGKTISDFTTYMQQRFGLSGCQVRWTSNIYTSNEELFTWVTQTGRKFDVMVPTNYTVETMEKAGLLVNLNKNWLPNYECIFGPVPADTSGIVPWIQDAYQPDYPAFPNGFNNAPGFDFRTPAKNLYQYRMPSDVYPIPRGSDYFTWDEQTGLLAVPYQWGTTGIGYRTDVFARQDIEDLGWKVFELATYENSVTHQRYDLTRKKMMLDDMREVFTAAHKAVGWDKQEDLILNGAAGWAGQLPTAIAHNPDPPYSQEYQWSSNEILKDGDGSKVLDSTDWLLSWQGTSWGFNTPQQGPWLIGGERLVDQAWSGDIMYAVRPNSSQFQPVDYFVPKQGGARWIDNLTIHRECEKLWLAHQFINYIHDPVVQADISTWNLYATPSGWSFEILHKDPLYSYRGQFPDGSPYYWNPAEDYRIYGDFAVQGASDISKRYDALGRPPILARCEYQHDVGVKNTLRYFRYWRTVKF